jgi:GT2 family glycosyltransferase
VKKLQDQPLVSFIIATYNRPNDLHESIQSILNQDYRPIEIVVVSSSTDDSLKLFSEGGPLDRDCIQYHHFSERMGVPKARNIGYQHAKGEVLVTIDDDATLPDSSATDEIVSILNERDKVGVLAFQSRNYWTGELIRMEIPNPIEFGTPPSKEYATTHFIGVGNAIRRSSLKSAGMYPEHFGYGFEEMDLSLRIFDAGYDILYTPSVVVHHKKTSKGRRPTLEVRERQIENRIKLTVRNLPWRYVFFSTVVWSCYWLLWNRMAISALFRIYRRLFEQRHHLLAERNVIQPETIARFKSNSDMLYFWCYGPHPRRLVSKLRDGYYSQIAPR